MNVDGLSRYRGALLGLACGDAIGGPLEFCPRSRVVPVSGLRGGGKFGLAPGEWTDDTAMALCLADSLLACDGLDPQDQMQRYWRWAEDGENGTRSKGFGLGKTVLQALFAWRRSGNPLAGPTAPHTAGNGSLMRLAPVVLWAGGDIARAVPAAAESSLTTHGAAEAVDACRLLAVVLCNALAGKPRDQLLDGALAVVCEPALQALAQGEWREKQVDVISGSGYAVASLEAALWCVHHHDSYAATVLAAANLGDDADTTAAIAGQIAGALYGEPGIPADWRALLFQHDAIVDRAERLWACIPPAAAMVQTGRDP